MGLPAPVLGLKESQPKEAGISPYILIRDLRAKRLRKMKVFFISPFGTIVLLVHHVGAFGLLRFIWTPARGNPAAS